MERCGPRMTGNRPPPRACSATSRARSAIAWPTRGPRWRACGWGERRQCHHPFFADGCVDLIHEGCSLRRIAENVIDISQHRLFKVPGAQLVERDTDQWLARQ